MKTFLILPHQLFAEEYLPEEEYEYILWEHPQYFTKYNYNKNDDYILLCLCYHL